MNATVKAPALTVPAIGQPFQGGIYAGLTIHDNQPVHLVLLPDEFTGKWKPAMTWAMLWQQLAPRIAEAWWRGLAYQVLFHDPRPDALLQSPPALMAKVAPHKRLLSQSPDKGLPIGNLSSQFFANVYLDALDQFVKHRLRVRHYVRYVDDFVLLHESPQQLNAWLAAITAFLPQLGAELNPAKTILQPLDRGLDFVGQVIKPWRRSIRRRTFHEALARTNAIDGEDLAETANSYFGLLRQASASHHDRARLANSVRRRGHSVNQQLTQTYR